MKERWYTLIGSLFLGACIVLVVFWIQGRQVAMRVAPIQAQLEEHAKVITVMLESDRAAAEKRTTAIEARILELEARPAERVVIREVSRPVPVFARGKAIGR